MSKSGKLVYYSALACILSCAGEFAAIFILGLFYPGYNHLTDTMSLLGASKSPVSGIISVLWIVFGLLFLFFAFGLNKAFIEKNKFARIAALLIFLYGLGEGIGSGVFKADRINDVLTCSAIIHDIVGGIGVVAALLLPLVMVKIIPETEFKSFRLVSRIVFVAGLLTVFLFEFRFLDNSTFLSVYKGLWQRLFMLNFYIYLTLIASIMIKRSRVL